MGGRDEVARHRMGCPGAAHHRTGCVGAARRRMGHWACGPSSHGPWGSGPSLYGPSGRWTVVVRATGERPVVGRDEGGRDEKAKEWGRALLFFYPFVCENITNNLFKNLNQTQGARGQRTTTTGGERRDRGTWWRKRTMAGKFLIYPFFSL